MIAGNSWGLYEARSSRERGTLLQYFMILNRCDVNFWWVSFYNNNVDFKSFSVQIYLQDKMSICREGLWELVAMLTSLWCLSGLPALVLQISSLSVWGS